MIRARAIFLSPFYRLSLPRTRLSLTPPALAREADVERGGRTALRVSEGEAVGLDPVAGMVRTQFLSVQMRGTCWLLAPEECRR